MDWRMIVGTSWNHDGLPAVFLAHHQTIWTAPDSWLAGWMHPWSGLDHWLATATVGVLGASMGRQTCWLLPACFVAGMLTAAVAAGMGLPVPGIELWLASSVMLLGLALLVPRPFRFPWAVPVVFVSGFMHGHAHIGEMPLNVGTFAYMAGMLFSTILLHVLGMVAGLWMVGRAARGSPELRKAACGSVLRTWALATSLVGVWLFVGRL